MIRVVSLSAVQTHLYRDLGHPLADNVEVFCFGGARFTHQSFRIPSRKHLIFCFKDSRPLSWSVQYDFMRKCFTALRKSAHGSCWRRQSSRLITSSGTVITTHPSASVILATWFSSAPSQPEVGIRSYPKIRSARIDDRPKNLNPTRSDGLKEFPITLTTFG